jgi:hypothetical protein
LILRPAIFVGDVVAGRLFLIATTKANVRCRSIGLGLALETVLGCGFPSFRLSSTITVWQTSKPSIDLRFTPTKERPVWSDPDRSRKVTFLDPPPQSDLMNATSPSTHFIDEKQAIGMLGRG